MKEILRRSNAKRWVVQERREGFVEVLEFVKLFVCVRACVCYLPQRLGIIMMHPTSDSKSERGR